MPQPPAYLVREEDLESLTGDWQALLEDDAQGSVFQHPAWLRIWFHAFGGDRRLRVLAIRDGARLLGVAAFIAGDNRLTLAGDPDLWDYSGLTVRKGFERDAFHALIEHLAGEAWDEIVLWGLAEDTPASDELPALAEAHGFRVTRDQEAVCPTVELPDSWDAYLASLNKKDRHELRRKMRRFAESDGEGELVVLSGTDAVLAALPDFIRLHVESREDKAAFMTEAMQHFFRHVAGDLARESRIRLYLLERGGVRLASVLCFDGGDSLMLYNSGYDPAYAHVSVGLVSKALCLQRAIEEGKRHFNFLRGDERYKYDLGARDTLVYRCLLSRV